MNHQIFLSLGSNLGDRVQNLEQACFQIHDIMGPIVHKSSLYETAAWGNEEQPSFLNLAVEIKSHHSPAQILQSIQIIEHTMGRLRIQKWGERNIDIDILLYDDQIIDQPGLHIPHPEMAHRRFVLVPLAEIAPHIIHPKTGKRIDDLLDVCPDTLAVERWPL